MATPPPLPAARRIWPTLLLGMLAANLVGGILFTLLFKFIGAYKESQLSTLAVPNLFLVPFIAGLVAAWFWRKLNRTISISILDSLWTSLLSLVAAAIFLREGAVCLVMGFPAIWAMVYGGILVGRWWFRRKTTTNLQLSIFPLLALLTAGDSMFGPHKATVVTDEILIHAPPERVWPHVLAFPEISDRPTYWIFRLGLPYPTKTTNGGNFVGADRQCIFSDGIVIKERVAEFSPNEKLTFDIVEQPTHPEVYGHITLHRGQFLLRDNHDGTTTLIGSSWYTLHVRPGWYFDLWARDMSHAVHLRVMNHVRRLAETESELR
jgi:hypothetical protein